MLSRLCNVMTFMLMLWHFEEILWVFFVWDYNGSSENKIDISLWGVIPCSFSYCFGFFTGIAIKFRHPNIRAFIYNNINRCLACTINWKNFGPNIKELPGGNRAVEAQHCGLVGVVTLGKINYAPDRQL